MSKNYIVYNGSVYFYNNEEERLAIMQMIKEEREG